jgi:hypothetical protein
VRFALIAAHFEHSFTSKSNFDLVAFFEIERVNHSRGQPHCQTIAPFRYPHQSPLKYISLVYLKENLGNSIQRRFMASLQDKSPAQRDPFDVVLPQCLCATLRTLQPLFTNENHPLVATGLKL